MNHLFTLLILIFSSSISLAQNKKLPFELETFLKAELYKLNSDELKEKIEWPENNKLKGKTSRTFPKSRWVVNWQPGNPNLPRILQSLQIWYGHSFNEQGRVKKTETALNIINSKFGNYFHFEKRPVKFPNSKTIRDTYLWLTPDGLTIMLESYKQSDSIIHPINIFVSTKFENIETVYKKFDSIEARQKIYKKKLK